MKKYLIQILLISMLSTFLGIFAQAEVVDVFAPFVAQTAPTITTTISETTNANVIVKKLRFSSTVKDGTNEIYCVIAYPQATGTYPGLLVLHGGTQNETSVEARVIATAKLGYIAIAPEIPGIADPVNNSCPNSIGNWKNEIYNTNLFVNSTDPKDSRVYDAVLSALQSFHLLQSNNATASGVNVDINNIGVSGISWGGYLSTMVAGILTTQVKAVFSNYGSGFYDLTNYFNNMLNTLGQPARDAWLTNFDAGRRADKITSKYFIAAATNDWFFTPSSVMKTIETVTSETNLVFAPNVNHKIYPIPGGTTNGSGDPNGCAMETQYFNYYLKNQGYRLPKINVQDKMLKADGSYEINFAIDAPVAINLSDIKLYYSYNNLAWASRAWQQLNALNIEATANGYKATIPQTVLNQNTDWYILASDSRPVSVSSMISSINIGYTPPLFSENFETASQFSFASTMINSGSVGTNTEETHTNWNLEANRATLASSLTLRSLRSLQTSATVAGANGNVLEMNVAPGTTSGGGRSFMTAGDTAWSDYTYTAKIKAKTHTTANRTENLGLVFRFQSASAFYTLTWSKIDPDVVGGISNVNGYIGISKNAYSAAYNGTGSPTPILNAPKKAIQVPFNVYEWNTYKVVASGNNFKVYINDIANPVIDWTDPSNAYLTGKIGLFAHGTYAIDGKVWFDDINVSLPAPEPKITNVRVTRTAIDGAITTGVDVKIPSNSTYTSAVVISALYKDGRLLDIRQQAVTLTPNVELLTTFTKFSPPVGTTYMGTGYKVVGYVWDTTSNIKPYNIKVEKTIFTEN